MVVSDVADRPRKPSFAVRAPWIPAAIIFAAASYWSVRFSLADYYFRRSSIGSLRQSIALAPGNASYHELLGEHMEGLGQNPDSEFAKSTALSPLDSRYWIRLGFRAEVEHNYAQAENDLLRAARVDRKFDPAWALMNFYFRRGRNRECRRWLGVSLERGYGDLAPVFAIAWALDHDADAIERHLPGRKDLLPRYVSFLLASHPEAAGTVARELASIADASKLPMLLDYCDRAAESDPDTAVAVWNSLCVRKLIPLAPLDLATGRIVTNGDFASAPSGRGFDWRPSATGGVSIMSSDDSPSLSIRFSGRQPEDCILLTQILPANAGARYVIRYEFSSSGAVDGLSWEVDGAAQAAGSPVVAPGGTALRAGQFIFQAPAAASVRLVLRYRRPAGSTLAEGDFLLHQVSGTSLSVQ